MSISHLSYPKIVGLLNRPDLNLLDYSIWNELVETMQWNRIKTEMTLKQELKRAVKGIRSEIVVESCQRFSNRYYRLLRNDGNYRC
jgi:hypothetical protein